jgi:enoyl-CoA hydratase
MLMHMLCTGSAVSSAEALRIGLVSHVLPSRRELDAFVAQTGQAIAQLPRDVIALGKSAFVRQTQMRNTAEAMRFASEIMVDNLDLASCKEGLDAFAEKRKPSWGQS